MNPLPIGQRFGKLILINEHCVERTWDGKRNQLVRKARFTCDCGVSVIVSYANVKRGLTVSCGCFQKQRISEAKTTHGMTDTPEYGVWCGMHGRCRNLVDPHYGGRGIRVCERWSDFAAFYADMGPRPCKHEIDRIDNEGNYEPGNCRWVPRAINANNKRDNRRICLDGVCKTLSEWSKELGVCHSTLLERLEHWPLREALTNPKYHAPPNLPNRRDRSLERGAE